MESFVDSAFGIHPVQLAVDERKRDSIRESGVMVEFNHTNTDGVIEAESKEQKED